MNTFKKITFSLIALLAIVGLAQQQVNAQATMTTTTTSASVSATSNTIALGSTTGVTAPYPNNTQRTVLYMDKEAMFVTNVIGTTAFVTRGVKGTSARAHISGITVYIGPDIDQYFTSIDISGACTANQQAVLPRVQVPTGKVYTCNSAGRWGPIMAFLVPAANCSWAPTTLTTTNVLTQIGASTLMVAQGTSNAAAGTLTETCNISLPSNVTTGNGAQILDITAFNGFQTTAPTSIGTSTLGAITFPVAASSETASTVTPVAQGGTVTLTGVAPATTTSGAFYSYKATYSTPVFFNNDLQVYQFTIPWVQSAAAAMIINTPGLLVHYVPSPDILP